MSMKRDKMTKLMWLNTFGAGMSLINSALLLQNLNKETWIGFAGWVTATACFIQIVFLLDKINKNSER